MKLTQTIREAFVRAAMNDVPTVDYDTQIRELALKAHVEALPELVRKAWNDPDARRFIATTGKRYGGIMVHVPGERYSEDVKIAEKYLTKLNDLGAKRQAQNEQQAELRRKLEAVARSASTRKQLAGMLPEFEKYLPADEPAALRTVPVVANVVADFTRAGWPKGVTAARAKKVAA